MISSCQLRSLLLEAMIEAVLREGIDFSSHDSRCWEYDGELSILSSY